MKRPITHVTINEKGEIHEIHSDLRLYKSLICLHQAPPLQTLFSLKNDALLLPDGTRPQQLLDQFQILWTISIAPFINPEFLQDCPEPEKIPTFVQLRSSSPQTAIDLLIEPTTNPCNPQNAEIQIQVTFNDSPQNFDRVLLDLYSEPDLRQCITTFIDEKDDRRYINDVSRLVENVIELRRQFHRFKMKLTQSEMLDDQ